MLPVEFDFRILSTLPLPSEETIARYTENAAGHCGLEGSAVFQASEGDRSLEAGQGRGDAFHRPTGGRGKPNTDRQHWGSPVRVRAFDPKEDQLADMVKELRESQAGDIGQACTVALVAPYYLLVRDAIQPREGLTLFANNSRCKASRSKGARTLNRVFCLLSLLDPSRLESFPFVGTMNGLHVLDISFIPEKYRLDLRRAEEIAIRTLSRWADSVMELFRHGRK